MIFKRDVIQERMIFKRINDIQENNILTTRYAHIYDAIINKQVQLVVNTPIGSDTANDDSYVRKAAIKAKVPYFTTVAAAKAAAKGIVYVKNHKDGGVNSIQELHSRIK